VWTLPLWYLPSIQRTTLLQQSDFIGDGAKDVARARAVSVDRVRNMLLWIILVVLLTGYHNFGHGKTVGKSTKTECTRLKGVEILPKDIHIIIFSNMAVGIFSGHFTFHFI